MQIINVTVKTGILDVRPYFPGEQVKLVGENAGGIVYSVPWGNLFLFF